MLQRTAVLKYPALPQGMCQGDNDAGVGEWSGTSQPNYFQLCGKLVTAFYWPVWFNMQQKQYTDINWSTNGMFLTEIWIYVYYFFCPDHKVLQEPEFCFYHI